MNIFLREKNDFVWFFFFCHFIFLFFIFLKKNIKLPSYVLFRSSKLAFIQLVMYVLLAPSPPGPPSSPPPPPKPFPKP